MKVSCVNQTKFHVPKCRFLKVIWNVERSFMHVMPSTKIIGLIRKKKVYFFSSFNFCNFFDKKYTFDFDILVSNEVQKLQS